MKRSYEVLERARAKLKEEFERGMDEAVKERREDGEFSVGTKFEQHSYVINFFFVKV